jgi:hypothetical protein
MEMKEKSKDFTRYAIDLVLLTIVLVAGAGATSIAKYSPEGDKVKDWYVGGVIETNGMGIGPGGEIYIAADNNRILKYSPDGEKLAEWIVEGATDIKGIAIGRGGEVFVTINNSHRVVKYSPSGRRLAMWGYEGDATGIAIDPTNGLIIMTQHS